MEIHRLIYYYIRRRRIQHTNINETAEKINRRTEGKANIFIVSVNVAVPHALPSSSMKIAPKLEPTRVALVPLPKYLQDHIASHMATMLNLFNDVKKKEVELSKFNKTENENDMNIPTFLKSMKNPLSGLKAVKGMDKYEQLETGMDTLLQNYKVQATKINLEGTKLEGEYMKKELNSAISYCISDIANTITIVKLETANWLTGIERK